LANTLLSVAQATALSAHERSFDISIRIVCLGDQAAIWPHQSHGAWFGAWLRPRQLADGNATALALSIVLTLWVRRNRERLAIASSGRAEGRIPHPERGVAPSQSCRAT